MSDHRLAQLAAKLLADELPQSAVVPTADGRAAGIQAVREALAARRTNQRDLARRRSRNRVVLLATVAAAAAAALLMVWTGAEPRPRQVASVAAPANVFAHELDGAALVSHGGGASSTLGNGASIEEGSRITTPRAARVALDFQTGSRVELAEATDLTLEQTIGSQQLFLASGRLQIQVAKVKPGSRFLVKTRDAEVEVKGTAFTVDIVPADPTCGDGATTRVAVTEGLVQVSHRGLLHLVHPGEHWPTQCAKVGLGASTLALQNDLLAQAIALRNAGRKERAVEVLESLMAEYPDAPLAESAAVERMGLLYEIDRVRGAQAASEYLARFPNGYGRPQAEALRSRRR